MTQAQVAEELGCDRSTLSKIGDVNNSDNITIIHGHLEGADGYGTSQKYFHAVLRGNKTDYTVTGYLLHNIPILKTVKPFIYNGFELYIAA